MKKLKFLFYIIAWIAIISDVQTVNAQNGMDYEGPAWGHYSKLRRDPPFTPASQNQNNEKAIGLYTELIQPLSALEINTDFTHMPAFLNPLWYNRGEVFRTDCPATEAPFWRMLRGGTPIANIFNPTIGLNRGLVIETVQSPGGWMALRTAQISRMFIADGGGISTDGFVGIGNGFTAPQNRLHLNETTNNVIYTQWTNGTTGATAADGFKTGIDANGIAQLIQQENSDMKFYTNNRQRLTIDSIGFVTINTLSSNSQMLVIATEKGTLTTANAETLLAQSKTIAHLEQKILSLESRLNQLIAQNPKAENN